MKPLLLLTGGQPGGRLDCLADAVAAGVAEAADELELTRLPARDAGVDDLLAAGGILIGSPEKFGYMAGVIKDFFDRTFYPAEGKTEGLPYAVFVSAGNDGSGAVSSIERIVTGYRWSRVAEPVIVRGAPDAAALERCRELGETMAAGLELGIF
jgi:multimeric flavodoxin WrbA